MSEVADITPPHKAERLLRDALKIVERDGATAAFVVLLDDEGRIWYDSVGGQIKDVLWAIESTKLKLLRHTIDSIIEDPLDA